MVDSTIEKEDIELLKRPGMTCIHNKKFMCGSFKSHEEFHEWGGEKWCDRMCIGKTGKPGHNKRGQVVNEGLAHKEAYTGNKTYRWAIQNSINAGLLSKKYLTNYDRETNYKREKGRRRLRRLRGY